MKWYKAHIESWSAWMLTLLVAFVVQSAALPVLQWAGAESGPHMCSMENCQCDDGNACSCMINGHDHESDGEQHLCSCSFPNEPEAVFAASLFDKALVSGAPAPYTANRQCFISYGNLSYSYLDISGLFRPPRLTA